MQQLMDQMENLTFVNILYWIFYIWNLRIGPGSMWQIKAKDGEKKKRKTERW